MLAKEHGLNVQRMEISAVKRTAMTQRPRGKVGSVTSHLRDNARLRNEGA